MKKINIKMWDGMLKSIEIASEAKKYNIDNNQYYIDICKYITFYECNIDDDILLNKYYFNKIQSAMQYLLKELYQVNKII